uniref:C-type lectin domain-containing protein n=2 Tax=Panagrellus redivivus TaxID=6233 RepID=A0A7E4VA80_PANRE
MVVTVSFAENASVSDQIGALASPGLNLTSSSNFNETQLDVDTCVYCHLDDGSPVPKRRDEGFVSVSAASFTALQSETVSAVSDRGNFPDGQPCSANLTNAWLDLVIIIEQSATTQRQWSAITGFVLSQIAGRLTLSNTESKSHTSRIAIVGYNTNATLLYSFSDTQAIRNIMFVLSTSKPVNANDDVDVNAALKFADNYLYFQSSFRLKGVILVAATLPNILFRDTFDLHIIKMVTVSFAENASVSDKIGALATPGLNLTSSSNSNDTQAVITQLNCDCNGWYQLQVGTVTYGECFFGSPTTNMQAVSMCVDNYTMAVANTPARVDFLTEFLSDLYEYEFSIGLSRSDGNSTWIWANSASYEGYPAFLTQPTNSDTYGYLSKTGDQYQLKSDDGMTNARYYTCQRHACDTDHICDLET